MTGKVFGKLTVLRRADEKRKRGSRTNLLWECRCECGEIVYRSSDSLTDKKERMCVNCLRRANAESMVQAAGFVEGTQLSKISDMRPSAANTSGTRGVYWHKKQNKWYVRLRFQGKLMYLGSYDKYEDAVKVRQRAEEEVYGAFLLRMNLLETGDRKALDVI
ncbi:MAG: hypothetical protein E7452_01910 [Ruminococcaceae bacterium]|nr:hypothetical protein [Oscillospiraceae bacterium]MBQ4048276.1 hypothetical protein [Clostridia bacterium]